jgi:hypothetical protein
MPLSRALQTTLGVLLLAMTAPHARAAQPAREHAARAADARRATLASPLLAQAQGTEQPELRPRYEPVPPEPKSSYNNQYLFAMTRGVADSTIHPAGKVPLYLLTVPLDIVLLPFALIGGFFG